MCLVLEVERSWRQLSREMVEVEGAPMRDLEEEVMRAMRRRGWVGRRVESWERKWVPTPPTPGGKRGSQSVSNEGVDH